MKNTVELVEAITVAFRHDAKVLIERAVQGRELEVAVLGTGDDLTVSEPGEVVSVGGHEFYDYDAKYMDEYGSRVHIPAPDIGPDKVRELQELTKKAYTVLECTGFARIDFFMNEQGAFILNEVNTLPGFTDVSMYPKLMEHAGVPYATLIIRLLKLASD